jgi:hypothetical protein
MKAKTFTFNEQTFLFIPNNENYDVWYNGIKTSWRLQVELLPICFHLWNTSNIVEPLRIESNSTDLTLDIVIKIIKHINK